MGRIRRIIWKGENGVTATTTLFPHANSRSHLGTLSHFVPWNKPIHGLELFQFAAVSPVLLTRANTLDRSRHFEQGTFLNRRHYRDVWYMSLTVSYRQPTRGHKISSVVILMASSYFIFLFITFLILNLGCFQSFTALVTVSSPTSTSFSVPGPCTTLLYDPLHGISYCVTSSMPPGAGTISYHFLRTIWRIALSCRGSYVTVYPAQRIHLRKWSTSFTLFSGEIRTGKKAGQSFSEDMAKQPVGGCWGHYVRMCTLFTRSKWASTYRCITIPATATPVPFAPLHNTA